MCIYNGWLLSNVRPTFYLDFNSINNFMLLHFSVNLAELCRTDFTTKSTYLIECLCRTIVITIVKS